LSKLAFAIEFQEFPPFPVDLIETTLTAYEKGESL
jgi:hypothetical protein